MKRWSGIWLIFLIVGMSVSMAFSSTPVAATTGDPYEEFWQILNREAELVVQFNSSGNVTLAQELIQNSRLGAENAANISALIWQALEELKESGVKTYYTAEELREMAQNISRNGLPRETVQGLKEQGWTDEQIQALEDYIIQNAGEINEDFNMTAFLEDFSIAFINVAFKYNEYEAWTLKKWKWENAVSIDSSVYKGESMINPLLAAEWVEFYRAYENGNVEEMNTHIRALKEDAYKLMAEDNYQTGRNAMVTSFNGESLKIVRISLKPSPVLRVNDGGLVINLNTSTLDWKDEYYWPGALRAYELISNVESLVETLMNDNSNPEVKKILNEKVAELKRSLIVYKRSSSTNPIKPPIKNPIGPIDPPESPITLPTTIGGYETPDPLTQKALNINDNEGILEITDVDVIVDVNQPGRIEYHVRISLSAENNAINNIRIDVQDYTSHDADSGSLSFLNAGESYTWESKRFSYTHSSGGELTISGRVEVTYTPSCNDVPLSKEEPLSTSPSCGERTITKDYSATVDLTSPVDWNKVDIRVEASRESITEGESVTYRVIVENNQNAEIDDVEYSVTIPFSPTNSRTYSGTVDLQPDEEQVVLEKTVTYTDAGTYVVHASIYWNGHSKSAEKSVTVTSGTLSITGVDVSPANPTHGDTVSFDVSLKNPVSRSRTVTVKLFIDGVEKSSKTITIGSGSTGVVSLTWSAQAGEHEWRIEVWEGGKLEASRSGGIEVNSNKDNQESGSNTVNANLEITGFACMPKEVGLYEWGLDQDKVSCTVAIQNKGPRIQIAPRVVIDDIETFWLNTRILSGNSSLTIKYEVKFSDGLAQIMYGPSATALNFVRTVEERGGTVCQRGVCYNSTRIYHLPKNHTISLKIYKSINFMPTTEALTQSEKEVITVKYDGYVEKRAIVYYLKIGKTSAEVIGLYITVEYAAIKAGAEAGLKELGKEFLKRALDWLVR